MRETVPVEAVYGENRMRIEAMCVFLQVLVAGCPFFGHLVWQTIRFKTTIDDPRSLCVPVITHWTRFAAKRFWQQKRQALRCN